LKKTFGWTLVLVILGGIVNARADLNDTPLPTDDPKAVALYNACSKGDLAQVKSLVASDAPLDGQVGSLRSTPLIEAADDAREDILDFLISSKANLNLADAEGSTPLLHACWKENIDCALALIDAGADVNRASKWGRTPLMYAANHGGDRIIEDLLQHKVDINANCNQGPAIQWAVSDGELSTVKLLGDAGANPNLGPTGRGAIQYTGLCTAAANNNLELIDYLIGIKADVNGAGPQGDTPLMAAAAWRRPEAIEQLFAHGADPNLKDKEGKTALMTACLYQDYNCIRALLAGKADPDVTDSQGETALTQAGDTGETWMIEMLKQAGARRTDLHILAKGLDGPGLAPARAWGLAVGAIYAQRDGANPRVLGGHLNEANEKTMLQRDWRIHDKESLLNELEDLRTHGHHMFYRDSGAKFAQMSDDQFNQFIAQHADKAIMIRAMRASYVKWKDRTGLAWDLCRSANLVSCGFCAHYIDENEAWSRLVDIARTAQASFGSWQELSDNFLDGREIWAGTRDARFEACSQLLLNPKDPNSPWNKSPWKTDLSAN